MIRTHTRETLGTILYRAGAVRYVRDADAIACMAFAYDEIMKALV
jgi:hypothetical protein